MSMHLRATNSENCEDEIKFILPAKLFANQQGGVPFKTVNLRFSAYTTVYRIRKHIKSIMYREGVPVSDNSVVQLMFHRRTPVIMQRDVNNHGFEAYSYVRGEILDPELCDYDALYDFIGQDYKTDTLSKGTISAFVTDMNWLSSRIGDIPRNNYWGKKQDVLSEYLPVELSCLIMQYISSGVSYYKIRDSEIEDKLAARETRDNQLRTELTTLILERGDLKRFFDEKYADEDSLHSNNI